MSSPSTRSPSQRVPPHEGPEAREREMLLRRGVGDPVPPALQRPRYVPLPCGNFYLDEQRRKSQSRDPSHSPNSHSPQSGRGHPTQHSAAKGGNSRGHTLQQRRHHGQNGAHPPAPASARSHTPKSPESASLEVIPPREEVVYADFIDPAAMSTPELAPPSVVSSDITPGMLEGEGVISVPAGPAGLPVPPSPSAGGLSPPTRTLSPSRRASPIHNASAFKDASPIRAHGRSVTPTSRTPMSERGMAMSLMSTPPHLTPHAEPCDPEPCGETDVLVSNECRHLIGRGSQNEKQAAQWAHSLRGDTTAGSPYVRLRKKEEQPPPSFAKHWKSPMRVRSKSTDATGSTLGTMSGLPLRVTVSAQDKWRTVPPQQWVVPPAERMTTFVKRCGLAEPVHPQHDKSFLGFTVHIVNKGIKWHSMVAADTTAKALGMQNGDTIEVTSGWATYRGARPSQ